MKNAGKACNNRLYRHIRTFEKIIKNYFVIFTKSEIRFLQNTSKKDKVNIFIVCTYMLNFTTKNRLCPSNLERLFSVIHVNP